MSRGQGYCGYGWRLNAIPTTADCRCYKTQPKQTGFIMLTMMLLALAQKDNYKVLLKINKTDNELHNKFQRNNYTSNRRNFRGNTRSPYRRNYRNNNNTSDNIFQNNDDEPNEINIDFLEEGTEWSSPT
ncbi:hypothetical protein DPMN_009625 [Dreissena polymorpha]|uniref:Uncharacterized protein n=1 Tax=Dreissena polymorpha TaxID=45954 RepID=A0A9D4S082_DREPO|nr:hypothetical protein DPMN_009625 [Dreissena polymorpha]